MIARSAVLVAVALSLGGFILGASSQPAAAGPETYKIDPVHSMMVFRIKHLGASYVYGRFNNPTGTFVYDESDPARCSFEVEVKSADIDTNNAQRDGHLRSPDFFDAERFATISFKSGAVKKLDDKHYEVCGDLALHGVTKPLTAKLEHVGSGKGMKGEIRRGFETVVEIKRSDFGMKTMLGPVGDEVRLMIALEGVRQ